jgi:tetraacyldisaccharide 4'-kinase
MNLKKPKFWDQKKPNIIAYLLLPLSLLLDLLKFLRLKKKQKNLK